MIGSPQVGERVMVVSKQTGVCTLHRHGNVVGIYNPELSNKGTISRVYRQHSGKLSFIDVEMDLPNFGLFSFVAKDLKRLK